ncbi:MAG: hypothetical protein F4138_06015 [Acidimicrobiia bacterium]|nr:hypothetical protein [Acidimicrobiia bacterium]
MIEFQPATLLAQLAAGGLAFTWVTTRRNETGPGYGWLMRSIFGVLAGTSAWLGFVTDPVPVRDWTAAATAVVAGMALVVSILCRQEQDLDVVNWPKLNVARLDISKLDILASALGLVAVIAGGFAAGHPAALAVTRSVVGALFLGAVTSAMLLGHWYLVQPGLPRAALLELVRWTGLLWVPELLVMLWPTGMISVLNGSIDDGYNGLLGWFWVACVSTTVVLVALARAALKERFYAAVMAATGLLYLGIVTGFGMDLVARVLLDTTY